MRRPSARIAAAILCTAAALTLTACDPLSDEAGGRAPFTGLTGPEIINKAVAATRASTSVRLTVTTESADGRVQAFVAAGARGECTGTFSSGAAGTMEIVRTGGTVYTKSDEAMLRAAAADSPGVDVDIKKLTGRWVKARPGDRRTAESLRYCEPRAILDRLAAKSWAAEAGKKAPTGEPPSLVLSGAGDGEKWTASVATKGKAYVLRMRITGGARPLTVEFSEFGTPVHAKKPALG